MFGGNEPEELLYVTSSLIFGGYGDEVENDTVIYSISKKIEIINIASNDVKFSNELDLENVSIISKSKDYTFIKRNT